MLFLHRDSTVQKFLIDAHFRATIIILVHSVTYSRLDASAGAWSGITKTEQALISQKT